MLYAPRFGSPASLSNTDNAATQITVPGASAFSDMTSGTMLVWVYTTSVANAARVLFGKRGSTGGWQLVKRGVDGTVLRFWAYRATTPMSVDSPSGTLKVNTWQYVALTWDVNTTANCQMVVGGVGTAPQPVAVTVAAGSGAPSSDVALNLDLMAEDSTSGGWPGSMAAFAVIRRVLSVAELQGAAFRDWRRFGCAGLWYPGRHGPTDRVRDESGNGNHATISGLTLGAASPGVKRQSLSTRALAFGAMPTPTAWPFRPLFFG